MTDEIDFDKERKRRNDLVDNKTSEKFKKELTKDAREEFHEMVAKIRPPEIVVPQCPICAGVYAQFRPWIEFLLIKGHNYSEIARTIPQLPDHNPLDRRSIGKHYQNHMDVDARIIRGILEEEASIEGIKEDAIQGAITARGIMKVAMQKGYEDIITGMTTVEVKDLVALIKMDKEWEGGNSDLMYQEAENTVRIFMGALKTVLLSGTLVSREVGMNLLREIQREVRVQRSRDEIESPIENSLKVPDYIDGKVINESEVPSAGQRVIGPPGDSEQG